MGGNVDNFMICGKHLQLETFQVAYILCSKHLQLISETYCVFYGNICIGIS